MTKASRRERRAHRRAAAALLRDRRRANKPHSLASHAIARGETPETARSIAGALRTVARRIGLTGQTSRTRRTVDGRGRLRTVTRYTSTQFRAALAAYRPRKADNAAARARLLEVAA